MGNKPTFLALQLAQGRSGAKSLEEGFGAHKESISLATSMSQVRTKTMSYSSGRSLTRPQVLVGLADLTCILSNLATSKVSASKTSQNSQVKRSVTVVY